jgi:Kdo2-lipid IVA lauroyltransferase/acyltransferase
LKLTIEYLLFAGVARLVQSLPLSVVRSIARRLGASLFRFFPMRKALTLMQLRAAFPEKDDAEIRRIARGSYVNLITTIFELMWTPRLTDDIIAREIRVQNPELFHSVLRRGKGIILMTGHFGNWEWLSIGTARVLGHHYMVVVHPIHNPSVDELVEHWRTMHGNRVVPMGVAIREIVRTIRERGIIAMIADQSGPSGAYYVRLFGRHAATYEGPAVFALKTGAPIMIGFARRQPDGHYELMIEELPTQDLKGASEENLRELTRRHVRVLERAIREQPDHWLWQHKRWKHAPHEGSVLIEDPPED